MNENGRDFSSKELQKGVSAVGTLVGNQGMRVIKSRVESVQAGQEVTLNELTRV